MNYEKLLAPANNDAASSAKMVNPILSIPYSPRNATASANEKRAKSAQSLMITRFIDSSLAIMLRQGLNKSQFTEIMAELFMKGNVTPMTPKYDVVDASTPIKALPKFKEIRVI